MCVSSEEIMLTLGVESSPDFRPNFLGLVDEKGGEGGNFSSAINELSSESPDL